MQTAGQPSPLLSSVGMTLKPRRLIQVIGVVVISVAMVILLMISEKNWSATAVLACIELLLGIAIRLAIRERLELAAKLTVIILALSMGMMSYMYDGIQDAAIIAFPAILIFAAMFVSLRFFLGLLAAMLLLMCYLVFSNLTGYHVNVAKPVSFSSLVSVAAILVTTAYFVWQLASDLRQALQRLETENRRIH